LWEYLDAHNLLKTSFQRLDAKVAARNGGKGVPSVIRSDLATPSEETLTLGTNKTTPSPASFDDKISMSIESLRDSNVRAARIESNAAEKNTLRNMIFNLQTHKGQLGVDRLKALSVFDDPLAQSLQQQIEEIDNEITEYTGNLDSILGLEMQPPPL
jgi:hypothetical protein